jgi:hypothetical protein
VQSWVESVATTPAMAASSDDPPPGTSWLEICTAPSEVPTGTATVTENPVPYATVTAISALPESNLVPGSVTLGSGGSAQFTITGAMGFSDVVSVPVGAGSDSIQVPVGQVQVQETGDAATYVVSISTVPAANLISSDLDSATVNVAFAAGDVSTERTFTVSGVHGLGIVPAGSCVLVAGPEPGGGFPFNSTQTITEAPTAGYSVTNIASDPAGQAPVYQRRLQRQGGRRVVTQSPAARPRTEAWRAGYGDGRLTEEAR